ncbi:MAG: hypothetical protein RL748_1234 [Pseudomonadota bacterium]
MSTPPVESSAQNHQQNALRQQFYAHLAQSNYATLLPFDVSAGQENPRVGSKAARLGELCAAGFRVPHGFTVSVQAFHEFCRLNQIDLSQARAQPEQVMQQISQGKLPDALSSDISQALTLLGPGQFAVRSSSLAEDGAAHSMAGQFDTFLETPTQQVEQRVRDCWSGMFNPRVMAYTEKSGQQGANLRMGVVIQKQIHALYAGVLFTIDPRSKVADKLVIEWVEGLGEKLVSGEVNPERLFVSRVACVLPDNLPPQLKPALEQLVQQALRAEIYFDCPLDMEFCVDEAGLWLLQARPITALQAKDQVVWTNVNMAENFPHPVAPFTWSIVDRFYTYYMTNILRLFGWSERELQSAQPVVACLTGVQAGRIYYNINNWYEVLHFFPAGKHLQKFLDNYIGQNVPFEFTPGDTAQKVGRNTDSKLAQGMVWARLLMLHLRGKHHLNLFEQRFYEHRAQWRSKPYSSLSLAELPGKIEALFSGFVDRYYYAQGIADIMVLIFPGLLKLLIKRWLPKYKDDPDAAAIGLFQGLEIKSTEPARIITELAQFIGNHPPLQTLLQQDQFAQLEAALAPEQRALFERYMAHFGARCYHECMIVYPTFEERTDLFWDLVKKYQVILAGPQREKSGNAQDSDDFANQLIQHLPWHQRWLFRSVLKKAFGAIALREQGRIIRSLLFGEIRLMTLEIGKHLQRSGLLLERDDVFFLLRREIEDIVNGKYQLPETIPALIASRKATLAAQEKIDPPEFFLLERGRYYTPPLEASVDHHRAGASLRGVPVSNGVVRAQVRIILDPINDNRLAAGDILVTRTTDPGWTPLFMIAGGLILERGGLLSHGAIVAREFGIPAVVGVEGAVRRLVDGEIVTLNANTGEILRDVAEEAAEDDAKSAAQDAAGTPAAPAQAAPQAQA